MLLLTSVCHPLSTEQWCTEWRYRKKFNLINLLFWKIFRCRLKFQKLSYIDFSPPLFLCLVLSSYCCLIFILTHYLCFSLTHSISLSLPLLFFDSIFPWLSLCLLINLNLFHFLTVYCSLLLYLLIPVPTNQVNVLAVNRNIYRAREYVDASEADKGKLLKVAVVSLFIYRDFILA